MSVDLYSAKAFIHNEQQLKEILELAMQDFNKVFKYNFSMKKIKLSFFVPKTGKEVYERFCAEYFPSHLKEDYTRKDYFKEFVAQAFTNEETYGILIRTDMKYTSLQFFRIFIHELAHIFCIYNEIDGENFFNKYCDFKGVEYGAVCAGYAIWREFIADFLTNILISQEDESSLKLMRAEVLERYQEIDRQNPYSKLEMAIILSMIFETTEVLGGKDWDSVEKKLKKAIQFDDPTMYGIIHSVYMLINKSPSWKISKDEIEEIGEGYLWLLANKELREKLL